MLRSERRCVKFFVLYMYYRCWLGTDRHGRVVFVKNYCLILNLTPIRLGIPTSSSSSACHFGDAKLQLQKGTPNSSLVSRVASRQLKVPKFGTRLALCLLLTKALSLFVPKGKIKEDNTSISTHLPPFRRMQEKRKRCSEWEWEGDGDGRGGGQKRR